jgi:BASS family bile acid:Na+ symporter
MVLAGSGVLLLVIHWEIFLHISWRGMLVLAAFMLIALAIGHVMGGPEPENRTVLAIACSTRHIGVAVLVATTFQGPRTIVLMVTYLLTMLLVSIPYLHWRRHQRARRDREQ